MEEEGKGPTQEAKGSWSGNPLFPCKSLLHCLCPTPSVCHTVWPNVWFGTMVTRSVAAFLPRPAGQLQPHLEPWPHHPSPAPLPPLEPGLTHQESSLPPLRAEAQGPCSPQLSSPVPTYFLNVSARGVTEKGCPKSSAGALPAVWAVAGAGWVATTGVLFQDWSRLLGFCKDVCTSMNSSA